MGVKAWLGRVPYPSVTCTVLWSSVGELAFVRAAVAAGVCSWGHAVSADGNTVVVVSRCVKPTVAWLQLLRWLTCAGGGGANQYSES